MLAQLAQRVSKEIRVRLDHRVLRGHKDHRVRLVREVLMEHLAHRDQ
jgi:hypothetical protein